MGHLIFIILHIVALIFGAFLLLITIPAHLIYAAVESKKPSSNASPGVATSGESPLTRNCPRCKEEIRPDALICRFCRFEFPFVDAVVREQLVSIQTLSRKGLSNQDLAVDLNARGVKCLTNDGIWTAEIVENIRREFALDHASE